MSLRSKSMAKRLYEWTKDPQQIDDMQKKLNESLTLFQLDISIGTRADVAKLLESLRVEDIGKIVEAANRKLTDKIVLNLNLEKLQYVKGASWNNNRACLPGTRTSLIDKVISWARDKAARSDTAEIFLLSGVAGSGKTSIAHSIAQRCFEEKLLLSSFFFHQETAGLNVPDGFIPTLARDLARVNSSIAESIAFAIENDPALALAHSMSHQFQKLIVEPLRLHPVDMPLLIVIDALDEGFNEDFLAILCEDILHLPPMIRIFVTSRPEDDIMRYLSPKPSHIYRHPLDIHDPSNRNDVLIYIRHLLHGIAVRLKLGEGWPTDDVIEGLATKSEGLFIWASTVINYIEKSFSPEDTLTSILSESTTDLAPGKKMDSLYENILGRCNWDDTGFVKGYNLLMGTIMALRTPLSISAIKSLHSASDARLIDRIVDSTLGSLLPISSDVSRPLQVLHLSFREFLTTRADPPFFVDQKSHSQRLALSCLQVLNETLKDNIPGTGYLAESDENFTVPVVSDISEEAWYACRFWTEHVLDIRSPSKELQSSLAIFSGERTILWMEVTISLGRYQKWIPLWEWTKKNLSAAPDDTGFEAEISRSMHHASLCLNGMGRLEEALESINEAVELRRALFAEDPDCFMLDLSSSLSVLTHQVGNLGQHADALKICREVVTLCRDLVQQNPDSELFNLSLTKALTNISARLIIANGDTEEASVTIQEALHVYHKFADSNSNSSNSKIIHAQLLNNFYLQLSDLGRLEDALQAIKQSVELRRQCYDAGSSSSGIGLATSLNNLSNCLSSIGENVEALKVIQESVSLYRQAMNLENHSVELIQDLVVSLNNLSLRLLGVNDCDQASVAITEASDLLRGHAERHPAVYNLLFAMVLSNQSNVSSALGHQENALILVQEAVKLYREYPCVPPTYRCVFAKALRTLSGCLSNTGQHKDAVNLLLEAIQLNEKDNECQGQHSFSSKLELAKSLDNLSSVYVNVHQQDEASHAAAQRAIALYRELGIPVSNRPRFASTLYNVSEGYLWTAL
ncbi:TPR-like protein [Dendrothele bispora CBS 962.96]|uniref:TPR-like protein n=1 Tax=Dendrothele bispora (strain CBS 962.96) TaxID=1314807 RepID=A0A4S8MN68_DENBC|nr:TPR-like protein [Dendrothele bispora CBS 962.96]